MDRPLWGAGATLQGFQHTKQAREDVRLFSRDFRKLKFRMECPLYQKKLVQREKMRTIFSLPLYSAADRLSNKLLILLVILSSSAAAFKTICFILERARSSTQPTDYIVHFHYAHYTLHSNRKPAQDTLL